MGLTDVEDGFDAVLHLLDRQVVDRDGKMVAKVDDVELTLDPDGGLVLTGLLVGMPALLPRFGGHLGPWLNQKYVQAGEAYADRGRPSVIELTDVADIGSGVELSVARDGLMRPRLDGGPGTPERWRIGDLVGTPVRCDRLPKRSRVLDVRFSGVPHGADRARVVGLIVGPGRPGAMLGYDRKREAGPAVLAGVVRWLHRHARVVSIGDVEVDREAGEVRIGSGADLLPLLG